MADVMRWRYGETNPITVAVDSATVIEIGDLCYLDTDDAKPASSLADAGTKADNQGALHDAFLGVAMQRSRSGDTDNIRIATTGVFEFDATSDSYEIGVLVGGQGTGAAGAVGIADQAVEDAATVGGAIGRVVKSAPAASTKVLVSIAGTVTTPYAGVQATQTT